MSEAKSKSGRLRRWLLSIIWTLAAVTMAGIVAGAVMVRDIYSLSGWGGGAVQSEAVPTPKGDGDAGIEKYVSSVLIVVQNEALSKENAPADMIFIVSFNALRQELTTASLMGGMAAESEYGTLPIREIYAKGGPEALMKTLNGALGANVGNYACTDTYSLAAMIDLLGGITVRLSAEEAEYLTEALGESVRAGEAKLTGMQSMAHALDIRSGGETPFSVAGRQLTLVDSAVKSMRQSATKENMLPLLSLVLSSIRTDLDMEALRGFAYEILKAEEMEYAEMVLPSEGSWSYPENSESADVIVTDWKKNGELLKAALYKMP